MTGFALHGALWMAVGETRFGGAERVALLAGIGAHGSITQAAKAVGMSYKAAWDAVDAMNNLAGEPLVVRVTGGKGGGGTRLTARGEQLVRNFHTLEREHRRLVDEWGRQSTGIADDAVLIRRMAMKTSARNQFQGRVTTLTRGAVNDEVSIEIAGGNRLVAVVTHSSTESLGLTVGSEVFALIKASSVILMTEGGDARFSARNQLNGTISRIQHGAVNTEVVIELPKAGNLAAVVTHESCDALALAVGVPVTALFKASSVILGTAV